MPETKIYYYIGCTPPSGNYPGQCERRRSDIILLGFYGGTRGKIVNCDRDDAAGGEGEAADVDVAEGWISPNGKPQVRGKGFHTYKKHCSD